MPRPYICAACRTRNLPTTQAQAIKRQTVRTYTLHHTRQAVTASQIRPNDTSNQTGLLAEESKSQTRSLSTSKVLLATGRYSRSYQSTPTLGHEERVGDEYGVRLAAQERYARSSGAAFQGPPSARDPGTGDVAETEPRDGRYSRGRLGPSELLDHLEHRDGSSAADFILRDSKPRRRRQQVSARDSSQAAHEAPVSLPGEPRRTPRSSENSTPTLGNDLKANDDVSEVSPVQAESTPVLSEIPLSHRAAQSPLKNFIVERIRKLGRAVEQKDLNWAETIKREVWQKARLSDFHTDPMSLAMYEALMRAFLDLRHPKTASECWDNMIKSGQTPTVKTYTIMLKGAQLMNDFSGHQAFWEKMLRAGIQPDEHAWSVRISAMRVFTLARKPKLRGSYPNFGVSQILAKITEEWMAAARSQAALDDRAEGSSRHSAPPSASELVERYTGRVNGVPRPTLGMVKNAIATVAHRADKEIPYILRWAQAFQIELDLAAHNMLLSYTLRMGQTDEAIQLIRRMQDNGIGTDSQTWVILLNALFVGGFLEGLSSSEQHTRVIALLDSLKSKDGKSAVDVEGYSLVIDRLLKTYNNAGGAAAVLNHMVTNGVQPNAHVYTILMTSYFQREPPDLKAIEGLWNQIQLSQKGFAPHVDSVFYDRMIEGYATIHRTVGINRALEFFRLAEDRGMLPSFDALLKLVRALAERDDWTTIGGIVDDIRRRQRSGRGSAMRMGEVQFWEFIISTGLLRQEGITTPRQLMAMNHEGFQSHLVRSAARGADEGDERGDGPRIWLDPHTPSAQ